MRTGKLSERGAPDTAKGSGGVFLPESRKDERLNPRQAWPPGGRKIRHHAGQVFGKNGSASAER